MGDRRLRDRMVSTRLFLFLVGVELVAAAAFFWVLFATGDAQWVKITVAIAALLGVPYAALWTLISASRRPE